MSSVLIINVVCQTATCVHGSHRCTGCTHSHVLNPGYGDAGNLRSQLTSHTSHFTVVASVVRIVI